MATKHAFKQATLRTHLDVFLGKLEKPLGRLIFVKDGHPWRGFGTATGPVGRQNAATA